MQEVTEAIFTITWIHPLFEYADIRDIQQVETIFTKHVFDGVIHFAWLKSVKESCDKPFSYYENNILGTINLLRCLDTYNVRNIIFSSSATVYDASSEDAPFEEQMKTGNTTNPYGTTKFIIEQVLKDMAQWRQMNITCLRYFNPIWAHPSGLIWEDPHDVPTNLLPIMMEVLEGKREKLFVFWDDYNTMDWSCIRDFIHVVDVAQAHKIAWENLAKWFNIYNIWTGKGTSVLEMISLVEEVTWEVFPYEIVSRRDGDVSISIAKVARIKKAIGREAQLSITSAIKDALIFRANIYN